jgi:hypothetical protein
MTDWRPEPALSTWNPSFMNVNEKKPAIITINRTLDWLESKRRNFYCITPTMRSHSQGERRRIASVDRSGAIRSFRAVFVLSMLHVWCLMLCPLPTTLTASAALVAIRPAKIHRGGGSASVSDNNVLPWGIPTTTRLRTMMGAKTMTISFSVTWTEKATIPVY